MGSKLVVRASPYAKVRNFAGVYWGDVEGAVKRLHWVESIEALRRARSALLEGSVELRRLEQAQVPEQLQQDLAKCAQAAKQLLDSAGQLLSQAGWADEQEVRKRRSGTLLARLRQRAESATKRDERAALSVACPECRIGPSLWCFQQVDPRQRLHDKRVRVGVRAWNIADAQAGEAQDAKQREPEEKPTTRKRPFLAQRSNRTHTPAH